MYRGGKRKPKLSKGGDGKLKGLNLFKVWQPAAHNGSKLEDEEYREENICSNNDGMHLNDV